jgi:hypothetical protein
MPSSGTLCHVCTDVLEERIASIIMITKIGELVTTLALLSVVRLLVIANVAPSSPILVTLKIEAIHFTEMSFLQEPHGVTFQKTAFFLVNALNISNLTYVRIVFQTTSFGLVEMRNWRMESYMLSKGYHHLS